MSEEEEEMKCGHGWDLSLFKILMNSVVWFGEKKRAVIMHGRNN